MSIDDVCKRSKKMKIEYERDVRPHPTLSNGAYIMLKWAEDQEDGRFYLLTSSLLYSAFTVEAYINYIGKKHVEFWEHIERNSTIEKIKIIGSISKMNLDWGKRPYQTVHSLFMFRNDIVHAKSNIIKGEKIIDEDKFEFYDEKESWEKYPTIPNTRNAKSDILAVMEDIRKALGEESSILEFGMTTISEQ